MVSALLVVVAAYLLKRGADALSKTKFAQKVGETRLAKWLEERQKMTTTQDPLAKEKAAKEKADKEKADKERQAKAKAIGDAVGDTAADNAARDALSTAKLGKRAKPAQIQAEVKRLVVDQAKEAGRKAADDALANGASDAEAQAAAKAAAKATADARAAKIIELAQDPAHANQIDDKSLREAEVGQALADSGDLASPLTRDPNPKGGEFIDQHRTVWDVKQPNSKFPKPGMTVVDGAMTDITSSLSKGEKVIIDPKNMSPTDLADLKARVTSQGLDKDVKFGQ